MSECQNFLTEKTKNGKKTRKSEKTQKNPKKNRKAKKNQETLNFGKIRNYDEERVLFRKKKRYFFKSLLYKNGKAQNMPVVASPSVGNTFSREQFGTIQMVSSNC